MPSAKYSCSGSSLRLSNGSTATEGFPGSGGALASSGPRRSYHHQPAARPRARAERQGRGHRDAGLDRRLLLPAARAGDLAGRHAPDLDRLGDVLDPVPAGRLEAEGELVLDLVVHVAREQDPARLGQRLEPRGDVDAVAEDVAALDG